VNTALPALALDEDEPEDEEPVDELEDEDPEDEPEADEPPKEPAP
jgi:hypothetical protein